MAPVIYRKDEAAALLQCTVSWLEKCAAARVIPVRFISGAYAWTPQDLTEIADLFREEPRRRAPATPGRRGRIARSANVESSAATIFPPVRARTPK